MRDNLAGTVTSLMCVCWLHFHAPIGTLVHHMCGKAILRLFCLSNLLSIFMSVCLSGHLQLCFIRLAVDTFLAYHYTLIYPYVCLSSIYLSMFLLPNVFLSSQIRWAGNKIRTRRKNVKDIKTSPNKCDGGRVADPV